MAIVPIGISYTADVKRAREVLTEIARAHPDVREVVGCPVTQLADSSVVLSVRAWCEEPMAARRFEWDLLETAKLRFAQSGIEIPYPYRNIVLTRPAASGTPTG
jgi:small-conductance mechanosensitive channel